MKIKVLGKYGPYGKAGTGAASGYLLRDDNFAMLLDCGSGILSRLIAEIDIKDLDAIFISHLHFDHTSDLLPLRYFLEEKNVKVKIYTEKQDTEWYKILFDHPLFDVENIDENSVINLKGKKLTFYRMKHPATDLAIKVEGNGTFVYTGDTMYNDNLIPLFKGTDLAIVDCAKPPDFVGGHMTVLDGAKLKEETGIKRLFASHYSPDFEDRKIIESYGLEFTEEGKEYFIRR